MNKVHIYSISMLLLPLALSAFTHLWNPLGFPNIYVDENHYMRRTMQVLLGLGPQETLQTYDYPYDHPYFGQIFSAAIFKLIGYPHSLPLSENEDIESIGLIYLIPRTMMGILAIVDTLLVFKIGEIRYNRNVGFAAAIFFAVMPSTWIIRMFLLDILLLPFLLLSIFLALYSRRVKVTKRVGNIRINSRTLVVLLCGVSLGLAIFTKIPAITMIPLVGYLLYTSNKSLRLLGLWSIPVFLIPLIWPGYAVFTGNFDEWANGILFQIGRGEVGLYDSISFLSSVDPVLVILGVVGTLTAAFIKKDLMFILWTVPLVLFIFGTGGFIQYFHFVELLPAMSIASGFIVITICDHLKAIPKSYKATIYNFAVPYFLYSKNFWFVIISKQSQNLIRRLFTFLPYLVIAVLGIFGLVSTIVLININSNESFFELATFVSRNLVPYNGGDNEITMIGQHTIRSLSWIPMYLYDKGHYVKDVYPERYLRESLKTSDVLMIVDPNLKRGLLNYSVKPPLDELRKLYHNTTLIGIFLDRLSGKYDINQYPYTSMKENYGIGLIEVRSNYKYPDRVIISGYN